MPNTLDYYLYQGQWLRANAIPLPYDQIFALPHKEMDINSLPDAQRPDAQMTADAAPALHTLSAGGQPGSYDAFNAKFRELTGRDITQAEQSDNAFVQQLSNELFTLLPIDRQMSFSGQRLSQLDNADLNKVIAFNPQVLNALSADRIVGTGDWQGRGFANDTIQGFIKNLPADSQLAKDLGGAIAPTAGKGPSAGALAGPPATGTTPPGTTPPASGTTPTGTTAPTGSTTTIPPELSWVYDVGAADWARAKLDAKVDPKLITLDMLHNDMSAQWKAWQTDPKFADIYKYAQQYYASSGHWPTSVELNRYTQNLPNVPAILPDGSGTIPKGTGAATPGALPKWEVPKTPLPPGYEWRFAVDGTPTQYDTSPETKDLFSGFFQDPKTGAWNYDPMAGAADYLTYNKQSQSQWGDLLNSFINRTGRLPSLDEAHNMASTLWAGADASTRDRATQFAQIYGHYPTPYELEWGPAKDKNASTGGGGQNAAGLGQVPVFVPGIGTVLVQGESVGRGGFVFDPFQGIPDTVRPWVREILNGRITADQVPPEMKDWVNFATQKFQEQLPKMRPEDIPWGVPGPNGQVPTPAPAIDKTAGQAAVSLAYKQLNPNAPALTAEQLNDVGWLSQQDPRVTRFLDGATLKQFPATALALLDNQTLLDKVGMDTISKLPVERLTGTGQYKGTGFDQAVIAKLPNETLQTFPADYLQKLPNERLATMPKEVLHPIITDQKQRVDLGLEPPATTTTTAPATTVAPKPTPTPAPVTTPYTAPVQPLQSPKDVLAPAATTVPSTPPVLQPGDVGYRFPSAGKMFNAMPIAPPPLLGPQDVYTQTTPNEYANEANNQ